MDPNTALNSSVVERIRSRFGQQSQASKDEQAVADKAHRILEYLHKARRRTEYEWWLNDQFYQGEQYVAYNKLAGQVQRTQAKTDNKLVINRIKTNARYVVMWLNRDHPEIHAMPGNQADDAYVNAKKSEHYLNYLYDKLELNRKNKKTTLDAYKTKIGFQKILWDNDAIAPTAPFNMGTVLSTTTHGEVMIERVDPWEMFWDPIAEDVDACRYIAHELPRTLGEIRNNPLYKNRDQVTSDNKLASSFMRESIMRAQTVGSKEAEPHGNDDLATVIVRELFFRDYVDGKSVIRLVVTTSNNILLRDEIWPLNFYPFEMYLADVQGNPLDAAAPIRDLRSPQRAYNQFMSIVQENGRLTAKIHMSSPRGANIGVITNEAANVIEYDPTAGGRPQWETPSSLPAYVGQHLDRLERQIDDIGGNHSASYGKSPGSKASGELVNKLQEGDSNNLMLMRDNLDDFERRVFKKALLTFKANSKVDRSIRSKQKNAFGKYDFATLRPADVSVDDDIEVITGLNMPHSASDRQEMFLNMKKEGILTAKDFLKAVNMEDLDNATKSQVLDIERALDENNNLINGKLPTDPVMGEDHDVHIGVHAQLIKSPEFLKAKDQVQANILDHYDKHINMSYMLRQIANALNVDAIKRSENVMLRQEISQLTPVERTQALAKMGVQSDAAEIQMRGGLDIQDPQAAELQAQKEDLSMMDGKYQLVSLGDNHQVHIETHAQLTLTPAWDALPEAIKRIINQHINHHEKAMQAVQSTPGLIPQPGQDIPNQPDIMHAPKPGPAVTVQGRPVPAPVVPPVGPPAPGRMPVTTAALNPRDPTQRPLMKEELIQHRGAVKHQLASEKMMTRQQMEAEKAAQAASKTQATLKTKPKPKKKVAKA